MACEGKFYTVTEGTTVLCRLCPHKCILHDTQSGICGVRQNRGGQLCSLAYGHPVALQIDPIEKKPLMDFLPGTATLSLGTLGCNLGCCFCQNHQLACGRYASPADAEEFVPPKAVVQFALEHNCPSVAFTYNEPTVWAEYAMDIAACAHDAGLKTVLVSNAYISPMGARHLYPLIDAANFDVKGFSDEFYESMCGGRLAPVLEACRIFKHETGGHLELTNLVIPGRNDSPVMIDAYLDWVAKDLGLDTPLHFSAYFPAYHYRQSPSPSPERMRDIRRRALDRGFSRVALGNVREVTDEA